MQQLRVVAQAQGFALMLVLLGTSCTSGTWHSSAHTHEREAWLIYKRHDVSCIYSTIAVWGGPKQRLSGGGL